MSGTWGWWPQGDASVSSVLCLAPGAAERGEPLWSTERVESVMCRLSHRQHHHTSHISWQLWTCDNKYQVNPVGKNFLYDLVREYWGQCKSVWLTNNKDRDARSHSVRDVDRNGDDDGVSGDQVRDRDWLRGFSRLRLRVSGQQLLLISHASTSSQLCLGKRCHHVVVIIGSILPPDYKWATI